MRYKHISSPLMGEEKGGGENIRSSPLSQPAGRQANLPPSATKRGEIRPQSVLGRISPTLCGEQGGKENRIRTTVLFLALCFFLTSCGQQPKQEASAPQVTSAPQITDRIVLANGGVIEGKLVDETPEMVRIEWQDGIVGFSPSEIASIERGVSQGKDASIEAGLHVPTFESEEAKKAKWPPGVRHRVLLKNGEWANGEIRQISGSLLTVRQQLEGGGAIEMDFDLDRVEKIELWPPPESDASARLEEFMKQYPSLGLVQKGYYAVLTSEQDPLDLKFYLKTLDQFYHDFLLHFFDLIDLGRTPEPLDVIVFGTRKEFENVLVEIGYNARSNPAGFYNFNAKKLVFYNVKTDREIQTALQQSRWFQSEMTKLSSEVKAQYGDSETRIQGAIERASDEAEREELSVMGQARTQNVHIIRHEGGHQLFHLFGLTPLEVYVGGWLIEGLAVYCEPEPIGDVHEEKLMHLRFELEKNELMPLEYLLNFGRGTELHKLDPLYALLAYAESWAFVYFLMHEGYQEALFKFLREIKDQGPEYDAQGERFLLEKHLGKNLKTIEQEFFSFVKKLIVESIDEKTYQDYRLRLVMAS